METSRTTEVYVKQESAPETCIPWELVGYIQIQIWCCAAVLDRHGLDGQYERRSLDVECRDYCRVSLQEIQKKRSSYRRECRSDFAGYISKRATSINIPKEERSRALRKLFQAIDKAVNPERPIKLQIWDFTVHTWELPCALNFVPATRDSIDCLERVQVVGGDEQCAICLEDYDQPPAEVAVTRLPCAHYFHTHCAALWLHTNHVCPLCRFALPTQQP